MLFACCYGGDGDKSLQVRLVDRQEPPAHATLRNLLQQVCPWIAGNDRIMYCQADIQSLTSLTELTNTMASSGAEPTTPSNNDDHPRIVISTHACGSLTDRVLVLAVGARDEASSSSPISNNDDAVIPNPPKTAAAAIAVMPCCYTGTSRGTPYGIQRALGGAWAADIQRLYQLQAYGYHVDVATIPRATTPLNRILVGEYKGKS
mmetsp:Transcript_14649/g.30243  ORF Transcript_14649/g.30243 Transcript_14649/m.30243 type:complete len:205 (-) Transcript_14649:488-1102(-)